MHISIRAVDFVLIHPVRAAVEERLACALAWSARHTAYLRVLLSCIPGPGGQVLSCCNIQLRFRDGRDLVVEDVKANFDLAAQCAATRIDRLLRQAARRREALPWTR